MRIRRDYRDNAFAKNSETNLLHDTSLALGEGDVATRFICDEFDFNLSSLSAGFIIIVIIIVGGGRTRSFDTTILILDD